MKRGNEARRTLLPPPSLLPLLQRLEGAEGVEGVEGVVTVVSIYSLICKSSINAA